MAKIGLPQIDIEFIQKAVSAIDRSERGIALILCIDEKASAVTKKVYCYETEIVADDYSADSLRIGHLHFRKQVVDDLQGGQERPALYGRNPFAHSRRENPFRRRTLPQAGFSGCKTGGKGH